MLAGMEDWNMFVRLKDPLVLLPQTPYLVGMPAGINNVTISVNQDGDILIQRSMTIHNLTF